MIVAWTGHRPDLFQDPEAARRAVDRAADELREQGATRFLVGGQRGVDTWAALAALRQAVPYTLILPFCVEANGLDDFTRDWSAPDRELLELTIAQAGEVRLAGDYRERNRQLGCGADLLIAVWTRTVGGGTAETIAFAQVAGTPLREIILDAAPSAVAAEGRGV